MKYKRTVLACYLGFMTQSVCAVFVPLLYMTFYREYGISFGRLSLISAVFFLTQILVDFFCGKVAGRIGYRPCIIAAEIASGLGLILLAVLPGLLPSPFAGILICVVIYAVGGGITEVLGSPIIEACPFENKQGMMSLLHSSYSWGCVVVILFSTLFFSVFGLDKWRILICLWALIPLFNIINFAVCPIEKLVEEEKSMSMGQLFKTGTFRICLLLMVCAGASEVAMAQWASAFAESALHVSKAVGDLAGPCGFALFMALSRTFYGKYGEKIDLTVFMIVSGLLCLVSYLTAGLSHSPVFGLIGCALCGFSVGIMWPGTISISSKIMPTGGTALFALLALAGDVGAAVGPAIVGNVSQAAKDNLRAGVLAGVGFPVVLVICVLSLRKKYRRSLLFMDRSDGKISGRGDRRETS